MNWVKFLHDDESCTFSIWKLIFRRTTACNDSYYFFLVTNTVTQIGKINLQPRASTYESKCEPYCIFTSISIIYSPHQFTALYTWNVCLIQHVIVILVKSFLSAVQRSTLNPINTIKLLNLAFSKVQNVHDVILPAKCTRGPDIFSQQEPGPKRHSHGEPALTLDLIMNSCCISLRALVSLCTLSSKDFLTAADS